MDYEQMREVLRNYNWDNGFELPRAFLRDSQCDLAMALEMFDLADGYAYIYDREGKFSLLPEWMSFIQSLYETILAGKYPKTGSQYKTPYTNEQQYCLWRDGVPSIFFTDLP